MRCFAGAAGITWSDIGRFAFVYAGDIRPRFFRIDLLAANSCASGIALRLYHFSRCPRHDPVQNSWRRVYSEAYELTGDLYVGINAPTLVLLTGKRELAEQYAHEIAGKCASKLDYEKKDHDWLFAMQGEAAIILNEPSDRFYESAINEASQDQVGMVDSSYRQIVRLWRYLDGNDDRRIEPLLMLFETSPFRQFLSRDFLGRIATDN